MSLQALNDARKLARAMGIEGASRMKLVDIREAIAAAEKSFEPAPDVTDAEVDRVIAEHSDDARFAEAMEREESEQDAPEAAAAHEAMAQQVYEFRAPLDTVDNEPRADCADDDCATAAKQLDNIVAFPVETRESARLRLISEDPRETRAVLDVKQGGGVFRHLAVPGMHVTACLKARPMAKATTGSLNSVDCLECLDSLVEALKKA